ncbi:unnamed protein product [Protopolystoma xenopodis]|uniref:Uncharacterized protein n=1 Tax=Protopolystoma xenopodis TaxID=117903 RepID=A0A448WRH8_9PLAT|nr:unnamed protein product [Protopolystoma xenopodis]
MGITIQYLVLEKRGICCLSRRSRIESAGGIHLKRLPPLSCNTVSRDAGPNARVVDKGTKTLTQLATGGGTFLYDSSQTTDKLAGLRRRIRRLQDQLASRDVHLEIWRNKATALETRLREAEHAFDEVAVGRAETDRAEHEAKRRQTEVQALRDEVARLKTELLATGEAEVSRRRVSPCGRIVLKLDSSLHVDQTASDEHAYNISVV